MSQRGVVAIFLALSAPTLAQGQGSWPDRPIKFIVHVAAGGGVDMNARILVDRLNQQLPQPVLIENQGGGGGVIAARAVANAHADGYTFLFAGPGHAAQAFMHKQPPFDPIRDFIPVALVTEFPLVVVIKPSLPARTLAEFIALLKAEPDKHTFGSSGVGTPAKTPKPIIDRLAAEVAKVMQDPLTRKRYLELRVEPRGSAPQEFDTFFREQLKFNEEIITSAKLQQD